METNRGLSSQPVRRCEAGPRSLLWLFHVSVNCLSGTTAGVFVNLPGREGEAPAEPHAREQGFLKVAAQQELRPPNRTNFPLGPAGQPWSGEQLHCMPVD